MEPADPRVRQRAADAPAEEHRAGREDPVAQAAAILDESDERQNTREGSGDTVEHRRGSGG